MHYTTDKLLEQSRQPSRPVSALVAYRNDDGDYYIEMHGIDDNGRLLAGSPLTQECITELVSGFSAEHGHMPKGRIPDNLLYADSRTGHEKYVWYNPPGRRMMYFSKSLGLEDALYHIPGVVYVAGSDTLDVYAFRGSRPKDRLYRAPFFNTTDGKVCLGNAILDYPDDPDYESLTGYWEKKFWMTEFSHLGGSQNPTRNNLYTATKEWTEGFDYTELLPSGKSLKDLLR